ncbi:hypothetical protein CK203_033005 [Vitis vinifera]|uniref:Uncharacterized protein n=1 Tax=Vitis vinifera TaxID=29760 RepID=A0A438HVW8_VITVI|nr:hypothetical protein CK203_033005 [Vitis vinifera]
MGLWGNWNWGGGVAVEDVDCCFREEKRGVEMGAAVHLGFEEALHHLLSSGLTGRQLLQTENVSEPIRHSDDTIRVDPLDHFNKYRGGYDITNKHYWSSTIFTGVPGYAIGVVWLLCGVGYGGFLLVTTIWCKRDKRKLKKKRSPCYKQCYLWHILLASFFTILAIVASGLVLGGNAKFHSRARTVVDIIMETANKASGTIYNTTGAMRNIRQNLETTDVGAEASTSSPPHQINSMLKLQVCALPPNQSAFIVSGFLKFRRALYWLIVFCWFLTFLCWLFFGIYFFLENFSSDTCTALEDFQQNPYNNSLSSILPCDELLSAKSVLSNVSAGIYDLVNEVNTNISSLQQTSSLNLAHVCNPFSAPPEYQYQAGNCPANTIPIGEIPQVLKVFTCSDTDNGTCNNGEFISTSHFKTVEAYTTAIQSLLNAYPGMEDLVECQTVKDAFSEILIKHCKPLKRYIRIVWVAMVFLSVVMGVLVLVWTTQAHHEQNYHSSDGSVKPHITVANMLDSGPAKASNSSSENTSV